ERTSLIKKMKNGDKKAKDLLILGNLKLILSIIQRFRNKNVDADDLFQVGCIGLIKALNNFDPQLNIQFSTYGVVMILGEIKRFIRDNQAIKVSRSIKDLAYRTLNAKDEYIKANGAEPTVGELSSQLGCSCYQINSALESLSPTISLYEPAFNDDSDNVYLIDQISGENFEEAFQSKIIMQDVIKGLKKRERLIINLRYLQGKTQTQVACLIGISQAQVSRIEKTILAQVKRQLDV
ncbi:MAG: sigma-70 family RNA polymerase sigma factor, partial [Oscillospiraceae bacterium]